MDILTVRDLRKEFPGTKVKSPFVAVNSISFDLQEGEILGLLGQNGAGKTTTLQMLLGVLTPTSGEINYFGKPLKDHRSEIMEKVNFSSTYMNLPWDLTVKENLHFISYLYKIPNREARVKKIVKQFDLEKIYNKQMNKLSVGQVNRVNLAKSFINYPRVLLLDEPTASLDPEVASFIREFLLEEQKQFKVSIILTSHNMSEVEEVCDRVLFISKGNIIANSTPDQLAKTIDTAHVELVVRDGLKRLVEYCEKRGFIYEKEERSITIDVKEANIAQFLRDIGEVGVVYDEISIEKPTLEDYFLQVVSKKQ